MNKWKKKLPPDLTFCISLALIREKSGKFEKGYLWQPCIVIILGFEK